MAVEKLKLLKIVGAVEKFDDFMAKYIADSDIQVEDARNLINSGGVMGFSEKNPYTEDFRKVCDLCAFLKFEPEYMPAAENPTAENVDEFTENIRKEYLEILDKKDELKLKFLQNTLLVENLEFMGNIDKTLQDIFSFEFVKIRFGRLSRGAFEKLSTYLEQLEAIFFECRRDEKYVYGMYFAPRSRQDEIDDIFISLNFERIRISEKAKGTPKEAIKHIKEENESIQNEIEEMAVKLEMFTQGYKTELSQLYSYLKRRSDTFSLRSMAVHTEGKFYFAAWARPAEAKRLEKLIKSEEKMIFEVSDATAADNPPTALKNPGILRPFEMMVRLYSLPSYTEIDPTPILAITYIIMFGIMFGDIGQGLVLALGGFIIYRLKKIDLAGIVSLVGLSAALFGWIYGSIFGLEHVVKPLWMIPSENTTTILITAVASGAAIIVMSMVLNLINCVRTKRWGEFFFSSNGIAGLVFYVSVVAALAGSLIMGMSIPAAVIIFLFVLPLILIFLKQPLSNLVARRKKLFEEGAGSYFTESAFEMIEVILSYATNTVSFIRIGAFTLVHAGMMLVVHTLAQMAGGAGNIIIFVIGNIFVMCLEALLVGIQTLRLEFYEIFSRFYSGDGREFKTIKEKN